MRYAGEKTLWRGLYIALLILFVTLVLTAGCVRGETVAVCPSARNWTLSEEILIARDLQNMASTDPENSLIAVALDWANLRAQVRSCADGKDATR